MTHLSSAAMLEDARHFAEEEGKEGPMKQSLHYRGT